MRISRLVPILAVGLVAAACNRPAPSESAPATPPNYDALEEAAPVVGLLDPSAGELTLAGTKTEVDGRFGVPTFVWAGRQGVSGIQRQQLKTDEIARRHLEAYASLYGIDSREVEDAIVDGVHDIGRGPVIVSFHQEIDGIPVFRESVKVVMDQDHNVLALSGYLNGAVPTMRKLARHPGFDLDARTAITTALRDLKGDAIGGFDLERATTSGFGAYESYQLSAQAARDFSPAFVLAPSRAKKVWFHLPEGLVPAWYLELQVSTPDGIDSLCYSYVVSAVDGRILFRNNLVADSTSYTYRVWADTSGIHLPDDGPEGTGATPNASAALDGYQAPYISQKDITLASGPISTGDPWLADGATQTSGNNADAYVDLVTPDGFSPGDMFAAVSGPGAFQYDYDTNLQPYANTTQQQAAITQLFYDVNYFHDWYYDSGFDEASGNAQLVNYGRGGIEGDSLKAEAQDFSGRDNANMFTPADGGRPRMQMYVFNGPSLPVITRTVPDGAVFRNVNTAAYGPTSFDVTADVVMVLDTSNQGGSGTFTDGCESYQNPASVVGKIVFVDRGLCTFVVKTQKAAQAGAAAVIVANITAAQGDTAPGLGGNLNTTVGTLSLGFSDGQDWRAKLGAGTVTARVLRPVPDVDRDGTIDNQIVGHEWGHYISNRLIHDSAGLSNQMGRGMGEGWADFHAMLLTVRPEDTAVPSNATWNGVYGLAGYASVRFSIPSNPYYYGIRRYPYSTDLTKDPLTFKHIQDAQALPTTAPRNGVIGGANSEVHNTGEVWATMLWECYASLLRDTQGATPRLTFDQARDRMKDYIVAAYKITPASPTLVEARNAILISALARDTTDFNEFWAAFAKRGAGSGAIAPDRNLASNNGVVESFTAGNALNGLSASLDDSVNQACQPDGILGNGDTGWLGITFVNQGAGALSSTTATISATNGAISFPGGTSFSISPSQPFGTTTGRVRVALNGATAITPVDFTVIASDPALTAPVTLKIGGLTNYRDFAFQSTTDAVESSLTSWNAGGQWQRATLTPVSHEWLGPDIGGIADETLTSPVLQVGAAPLSFTFLHRFAFENTFDGGVIELSQDDGQTWVDIGAFASPTYNGSLVTGGGNPIEGRPAYTGNGASTMVTVNLGTAYANRSIRIRFRIGSDVNTGAKGWEIDDVAFSGILNLPFAIRVADDGSCHVQPTSYAGLGQTVDERTTGVTLTGNAWGGTGALTYQWLQTAGPSVSLTGASTLNPTFTAPDVTASSVLTFALTANDGTLASDPSYVSVTVRNVNRAPIASAGSSQTVAERTTGVTLSASGSSDPDGDSLTYSWTQLAGPPASISGASTASPTFTAPEVTTATDTLTFQVSVNDGTASSTSTVDVTVNDVNRVPVASAGANQTADERTTVTLDGSASSDADADPLTYAWTQVSGTPVTITNANAAVATFTADVAMTDTLVFQLGVTDTHLGANSTSTSNTSVTVTNVNRAPVANAGTAQTVNANTTVTLNGSGSADPDADTISYAWTQTAGPAVGLTGATTAMPTFTAPHVSSTTVLTFSLRVSDGTLVSNVSTVNVTVSHVNGVPNGDPGHGHHVAERATDTLDGSASSDPDGDTLTYSWTQTAGPTVSLTGPSTATPSFTAPDVTAATVLTFSLVVSDGTDSSQPAAVDVTVDNVNLPPVAVAGSDTSGNESGVVTLDGSGSSDPDGDALAFLWVQTSGPVAEITGADTATPSVTLPKVDAVETMTFSLTVLDGELSSPADTVDVTVNPVSGGGGGGCGCDLDGHSAGNANAGMLLGALGAIVALVTRKKLA